MAEDSILGKVDLAALSKLPLTVEMCGKIVSAIQMGMYKGATFNSFLPFHEPKRAVKKNGQLMMTEIKYGTRFMNSYLDITYPTSDTSLRRPTVIYTHGGGFFGGSKTMGDPMAAGDDANFLFEDIVNAGYNFVNVDYVLTPDGHFPDQLIQLVEAIDFLSAHATEYGLDMTNVAVMGSSAGAILTGQYGALLSNSVYRDRLGIKPKIPAEYIKCLVIDDAPFRTENYNWALRAMIGNLLKTVDMKSDTAESFNAYAFFTDKMPPCFFDAGPKDGFPEDMRACGEKLTALGVANEVYIPTEDLPHGFLNLARTNKQAREGEERLIAFINRYTS